jgi:hypothetical protein
MEKTMTIKNRHIFKEGKTHDGRDITYNDVLELYQNTKSIVDKGYKIPIKEGHKNKEQASKGWAENITIKGSSIYADLTNIDDALYEKIKNGYLPGVSVEVYKNFKWRDNVYESVIAAVALLGVDPPACELEPAVFKTNEVEYIIFANLSNLNLCLNNEHNLNINSKKADVSYFSLEREYNKSLQKIVFLENELKTLSREKLIFSIDQNLLCKGKIEPHMRDELINYFEEKGFDFNKCKKVIDFYTKLPQNNLLTQEFSFNNNQKNKDTEETVFAKRLGLSSDDLEKYGDN